MHFFWIMIAYKLLQKGLKVGIAARAKVTHKHSASISKKGKAFSRFHNFLSIMYVLKTYAKTGRYKLKILYLYIIFVYWGASIFDENHKRYYKNLKTRLKEIIENEN